MRRDLPIPNGKLRLWNFWNSDLKAAYREWVGTLAADLTATMSARITGEATLPAEAPDSLLK